MKVFVFGAGGVIGQHLMLCVPPGIEAHFFRKTQGPLFRSIDLTDTNAVMELLDREAPNVIVNLAGESNVDEVQKNTPACFVGINGFIGGYLASWCDRSASHLVHLSTQAVFDGHNPPYDAESRYGPLNIYGSTKIVAEAGVRSYQNWTIVRGTFCLGIRPIPSVGRENPAEAMLAGKQPRQVADRWFSVMFAEDAAESLWRIVQERPKGKIIHLGNPERKSRYDVAKDLGCDVQPAKHEDFPGLAPRAVDTTYAEPVNEIDYRDGLKNIQCDFDSLQKLGIHQRSRELALFFKISVSEALERISEGFGPLHNAVTEDFRKSNPVTDEELLNWYRTTDSYIFELSAYHLDSGFNYSGMCKGIAENLANHTAYNVLCLGDGIGDLTMELRRRKMNAVYHDLEGSRTAAFAQHRFWMYGLEGTSNTTSTFAPLLWCPEGGYDAVVSLDFLEHVQGVDAWVKAIHSVLRTDGLFVAQNAFNIGSGPEGSIPQHLSVNDHYEVDWDPMLIDIGFRQLGSQWYQKI